MTKGEEIGRLACTDGWMVAMLVTVIAMLLGVIVWLCRAPGRKPMRTIRTQSQCTYVSRHRFHPVNGYTGSCEPE